LNISYTHPKLKLGLSSSKLRHTEQISCSRSPHSHLMVQSCFQPQGWISCAKNPFEVCTWSSRFQCGSSQASYHTQLLLCNVLLHNLSRLISIAVSLFCPILLILLLLSSYIIPLSTDAEEIHSITVAHLQSATDCKQNDPVTAGITYHNCELVKYKFNSVQFYHIGNRNLKLQTKQLQKLQVDQVLQVDQN